MENIYFNDLMSVVKKELYKAISSVKIAVAWINFELFEDIFMHLLNNGIKLSILLNMDKNNSRYMSYISELEKRGASINFVDMPTAYRVMHHKFCVIDECIALLGSYNWTINATNFNFEDLLVTDNSLVVNKLLDEFRYVKNLSKKDILKLQMTVKCSDCKNPVVNICILDESGYEAKVDLYRVCGCGTKLIQNTYYELALYSNISSIWEIFEQEPGDEQQDEQQTDAEYDFEMLKYLRSLRNLLSYPIHAIGVRAWEMLGKNFEDRYIKILWKDRFVARLINNRYELNGFE